MFDPNAAKAFKLKQLFADDFGLKDLDLLETIGISEVFVT